MSSWIIDFWIQADVEASTLHPLEREGSHHLDAAARLARKAADFREAGRESSAEHLERQAREHLDRAQLCRLALSNRGRGGIPTKIVDSSAVPGC